VIATVTIVPLARAPEAFAHRTIRPEPAVAEILSGDEAAVRRRLGEPRAVDEKDTFWRLTPLTWATMQRDQRQRYQHRRLKKGQRSPRAAARPTRNVASACSAESVVSTRW
jgi:hypothetical protein